MCSNSVPQHASASATQNPNKGCSINIAKHEKNESFERINHQSLQKQTHRSEGSFFNVSMASLINQQISNIFAESQTSDTFLRKSISRSMCVAVTRFSNESKVLKQAFGLMIFGLLLLSVNGEDCDKTIKLNSTYPRTQFSARKGQVVCIEDENGELVSLHLRYARRLTTYQFKYNTSDYKISLINNECQMPAQLVESEGNLTSQPVESEENSPLQLIEGNENLIVQTKPVGDGESLIAQPNVLFPVENAENKPAESFDNNLTGPPYITEKWEENPSLPQIEENSDVSHYQCSYKCELGQKDVKCKYAIAATRVGDVYGVWRKERGLLRLRFDILNQTSPRHFVLDSINPYHLDMPSLNSRAKSSYLSLRLNDSSTSSTNSLLRKNNSTQFYLVESSNPGDPKFGMIGDYQIDLESNEPRHAEQVVCERSGSCSCDCAVTHRSAIRSLNRSVELQPNEVLDGGNAVYTFENIDDDITILLEKIRTQIWDKTESSLLDKSPSSDGNSTMESGGTEISASDGALTTDPKSSFSSSNITSTMESEGTTISGSTITSTIESGASKVPSTPISSTMKRKPSETSVTDTERIESPSSTISSTIESGGTPISTSTITANIESGESKVPSTPISSTVKRKPSETSITDTERIVSPSSTISSTIESGGTPISTSTITPNIESGEFKVPSTPISPTMKSKASETSITDTERIVSPSSTISSTIESDGVPISTSTITSNIESGASKVPLTPISPTMKSKASETSIIDTKWIISPSSTISSTIESGGTTISTSTITSNIESGASKVPSRPISSTLKRKPSETSITDTEGIILPSSTISTAQQPRQSTTTISTSTISSSIESEGPKVPSKSNSTTKNKLSSVPVPKMEPKHKEDESKNPSGFIRISWILVGIIVGILFVVFFTALTALVWSIRRHYLVTSL